MIDEFEWFEMAEWQELPEIRLTKEDIKGDFKLNFGQIEIPIKPLYINGDIRGNFNAYYDAGDQYEDQNILSETIGKIQYPYSSIYYDSKSVSLEDLDLACSKFASYLRRDLDDRFYSGSLWENISN